MKAENIKIESVNQSNFGVLEHFNNKLENKIKVIDFLKEKEHGELVITLFSMLFLENQFKIKLNGDKVILQFIEKVEYGRSAAVFVCDWQSYVPQTYSRIRKFSFVLPGDNFYILRQFMIPERFLLKIFLAKLRDE